MRQTRNSEIAGLTLAITRLSAAGKSSKEIQNYFECEMLLAEKTPPSTKVPSAKRTRRKRRKGLTVAILHFLGSQGKKGAHVKAIADAVGSEPANITAWVYTTGKKAKGLKKIKPATYALVGK